MTDDDIGPSDARMRELLREARPMPMLPAGFRGAVWWRIQRSEPRADESAWGLWMDGLVGLLLRPRVAFGWSRHGRPGERGSIGKRPTVFLLLAARRGR